MPAECEAVFGQHGASRAATQRLDLIAAQSRWRRSTPGAAADRPAPTGSGRRHREVRCRGCRWRSDPPRDCTRPSTCDRSGRDRTHGGQLFGPDEEDQETVSWPSSSDPKNSGCTRSIAIASIARTPVPAISRTVSTPAITAAPTSRRRRPPHVRLVERPLHLVCCAANDLSGDPVETLSRGARSAVLSKHGFSLGPATSTSGPTEAINGSGRRSPRRRPPSTRTWDRFSVRVGPAVSFLMTMLNLRLGLWLRHPAAPPGGSRRWPGLLLYREMFALTSASGRDQRHRPTDRRPTYCATSISPTARTSRTSRSTTRSPSLPLRARVGLRRRPDRRLRRLGNACAAFVRTSASNRSRRVAAASGRERLLGAACRRRHDSLLADRPRHPALRQAVDHRRRADRRAAVQDAQQGVPARDHRRSVLRRSAVGIVPPARPACRRLRLRFRDARGPPQTRRRLGVRRSELPLGPDAGGVEAERGSR